MAIVKIQIRRKTAQDWLNTNPVILPGEMGFELDTGRLKIGREVAEHWNDIPYVVTPQNTHTLDASEIFDPTVELVSAGQVEINLNQASHFILTVTSDIDIIIGGVSPIRKVNRFSLKIINGGTYRIGWPLNFLWKDGIEPVLSNETDLLSFFTDDFGATWLNDSFIKNLKRK